MICRDFEREWNEMLDAVARPAGTQASWSGPKESPTAPRESGVSELEKRLRQHAVACPACGQIAAGFERLQRAIHAWSGPPAAPADLADRIVQSALRPAARPWTIGARHSRPIWRIGLPLTMAAAAAAAIIFFRTMLPPSQSARQSISTETVATRENRRHETAPGAVSRLNTGTAAASALNVALADATEATWELARSASAPAARISREALDAATASGSQPATAGAPNSTDGSIGFMVSLSSYVPEPPDASSVLRDVGGRLAIGITPLSTTARHAFGFLLGSARIKPEARVIRPSAKGA